MPMDADTQGEFREQKNLIEKIFDKQDETLKSFNAHALEDSESFKDLSGSMNLMAQDSVNYKRESDLRMKGSTERQDRHEKEHADRKKLALMILTPVIAFALIAIITSIYKNIESSSQLNKVLQHIEKQNGTTNE